MRSGEALNLLADVTAHQWGMVTTAQARARGITRLDLSRLGQAGHLERLAHGVYMDAGTPRTQFDDVRAAWLSTDPKATGEARIRDRTNEIVVAGASAAWLHGIGDLWADRNEFVTPTRRQTQRPEIRYRQRSLDPADVTLVEGLPAMTMERTIADLVEDIGDLSLIADALRDASRKRDLDLVRLKELLNPLAARNGFQNRDGTALLNRILEIAELDIDSVARKISADTQLSSRIFADVLGQFPGEEFGKLVSDALRTDAFIDIASNEAMKNLADSLAESLRGQFSIELPTPTTTRNIEWADSDG